MSEPAGVTEHEQAVVAACSRLDVSRFPAQLKVGVSAHGGVLYVGVQMHNLVERDSKSRRWSQIFSDNTPIPSSVKDALDWVRSVIRRAILHELDECLLLDGDRPWDPHVDGRREF